MKVVAILIFILLVFVRTFLFAQDRDTWQQPERIMDSLNVKPGMMIGEVGAGSGYFTFKLAARLAGQGFLYANDIDQSGLKKIEKHCREHEIKNVKTIVGDENDPMFPADSLDLIIMVYTFHHLNDRAHYLKNLAKYLKAKAPVVIVERDPDCSGGDHHFMKKNEILNEIQDADYRLGKLYTFLARDNIYVCFPPELAIKNIEP